MYTHARQFPHLAGLEDARIREIAARAMRSRPGLIRLMRLRAAGLILGMILAVCLLARYSSLGSGLILVLVGGVGSAFVLCWNLAWINTVMYRATREEVERSQT